MKITLLTTGTLGDVRPYLALALGLKEAGHQVTLVAPVNFTAYLSQFDVPFRALATDTQKILESDEGRRWMASGNVKEFMNALNQITHEMRHDVARDILAACEDCDAMIVHPLLLFNVATLSEQLNKPFLLATPFPFTPATTAFPQFLVRAKRLPAGFLNRITHRIFAKVYEKSKTVDMNEWRTKLGLSPLRGSLFDNLVKQRIPILHAYSPNLLAQPKDWGDHNYITGSWKMDSRHVPESEKTKPQDDLEKWLNAGPSPIYFGFGSLPVLEPQKMVNMVIDITKRLNARAILAAGWSNLSSDGRPLPESIFLIKHADHESLFPRCSCVIHHGGAGTTHTALESGTPSVICSTYADQPFWGERITAMKIGRHIPFPKLTTENLLQAIRELKHDDIKARAAEIGKRMKAENGLQNALAWVEKQLPSAPVYKN